MNSVQAHQDNVHVSQCPRDDYLHALSREASARAQSRIGPLASSTTDASGALNEVDNRLKLSKTLTELVELFKSSRFRAKLQCVVCGVHLFWLLVFGRAGEPIMGLVLELFVALASDVIACK